MTMTQAAFMTSKIYPSLRVRGVDPQSEEILCQALKGVNVLEDDLTKTTLLKFLEDYDAIRRQEDDICTQDRERILLSLGHALQNIGSNSNYIDGVDIDDTVIGEWCGISNFKSNSSLGSDDIEYGGILTKTNKKKSKNITTSERLNENVSSALQRQKRHKEIPTSLERGDSEQYGICDYLQVKENESETDRPKLFFRLESILNELSTLKALLLSKMNRTESDLHAAVNNVVIGLKHISSECGRWKIQESNILNSIEQRKGILNNLISSFNKHRGRIQMEEIDQKEKENDLHEREYFKELQLTIQKMGNLNSDMREQTTSYKKIVCGENENLNTLSGIFGTLSSSTQAALKQFLLNRCTPLSPFECYSVTSINQELERRLIDSARLIDTENSLIANDVNLIDSVRQEYIFVNDTQLDTVTSTKLCTIQTVERTFLEMLERFEDSVNDFITSAKITFMTFYAMRKLDSCLVFSKPKLDVLGFDILHKKTYLEARNAALSRFQSQDSKSENIICMSQRISSKYVTPKDSPWKSSVSDSKVLTLPNVFEKSTIQTATHRKPSLLLNTSDMISEKRIHTDSSKQVCLLVEKKNSDWSTNNRDEDTILGCHEDVLRLSDFFIPMPKSPTTVSSTSSKLYDWCADGGHDSRSSSQNNFKYKMTRQEMFALPPWFPREDTNIDISILEQSAEDMAGHLNFHPQKYDDVHIGMPRRFLFYTRGIGVFLDTNGGLVDATGMPFPQCRRPTDQLGVLNSMPSNTIKAQLKGRSITRAPSINFIQENRVKD